MCPKPMHAATRVRWRAYARTMADESKRQLKPIPGLPKPSVLSEYLKKHPIETPGPWLAHYSTADKAFGKILPSGQLLMNPYKDMRDPVENQDLTFSVTPKDPKASKEAGKYGLRRLLRPHPLTEALNKVRDGGRIASLTRDDSDQGDTFGCCWARPRMWEQYADEHHGACLVFHRDRFRAAFHALTDKGVPFDKDVKYSPAGISKWRPEGPEDVEDTKVVVDFMFKHTTELFFTKTEDWRTEHEYRALLFPFEDNDDDCFLPFGDALEAVVVGAHYPDWGLAGAKELCDKKGVALRKIGWTRGRPSTRPAVMPTDDAPETERTRSAS